MILNHLNLTVTNPIETQQIPGEVLCSETDWEGQRHDLLPVGRQRNGAVVDERETGEESEVRYPATFHIGFIEESKERVNEINKVLKADGFDVPPPSKQHGAWTFYFLAPGGFTIEVLC